jgi:hypothetical protein
VTVANPRLLAGAVVVALQGLPGLTVYDGEVDPEPPVMADGTGRVKPYAVVYGSSGTPHPEEFNPLAVVDLDWLVQVTVAGGYQPDTLQAVHGVRGLLEGRLMVLSGITCGPLTQVNDPGPVRRDDDEVPPRYFSPLQFQLLAAS